MKASFVQSVIKSCLKVFMASTKKAWLLFNESNNVCQEESKVLQKHSFTKMVQEEEG